jgi:type 1 glutamine amidotransferase
MLKRCVCRLTYALILFVIGLFARTESAQGQTMVLLIAGSTYFKPGEHEYRGGCAVLADLLKQTPGVEPVVAVDWPKGPDAFKGVNAIVCFFDGGDKHAFLKENRLPHMQNLADAGVGFVALHQGVDVPKDVGERMRGLMGAAWEKGYSQRGHWIADFTKFPSHPITRGVKPFKIDDGWLYNLRFVPEMKGIAPLVQTVSPKAKGTPAPHEPVVGWAFERPGGGRSFAFTGCHLHSSFEQEGYRRFLVNGILWSAQLEVPEQGAPVALDPAELKKHLSPPPSKK